MSITRLASLPPQANPEDVDRPTTSVVPEAVPVDVYHPTASLPQQANPEDVDRPTTSVVPQAVPVDVYHPTCQPATTSQPRGCRPSDH